MSNRIRISFDQNRLTNLGLSMHLRKCISTALKFQGVNVDVEINVMVTDNQGIQAINAAIEDTEARYKNPRNLCSGSVRQLDNRVTAERHVRFVAFSMVDTDSAGLWSWDDGPFLGLSPAPVTRARLPR